MPTNISSISACSMLTHSVMVAQCTVACAGKDVSSTSIRSNNMITEVGRVSEETKGGNSGQLEGELLKQFA